MTCTIGTYPEGTCKFAFVECCIVKSTCCMSTCKYDSYKTFPSTYAIAWLIRTLLYRVFNIKLAFKILNQVFHRFLQTFGISRHYCTKLLAVNHNMIPQIRETVHLFVDEYCILVPFLNPSYTSGWPDFLT